MEKLVRGAGASDVDRYLAAVAQDQRAVLERLRRTIRAAVPEATETLSYRMPAFRLHGRILVYYAAFKDHCSLFPASGGVLEALAGELKPYFSGKGTLRFTAGNPIPAAVVKRIVKARVEEIGAARSRRRGSPGA